MDFNYGDIIEYYDNTFDLTFQEAKQWAIDHDTTFSEIMERRDLPRRYFRIGDEPTALPPIEPPVREVTEEEVKEEVRTLRNALLYATDFTMLEDAPLSQDEKNKYKEYRQFLRDFTKKENWWIEKVPDFNKWSEKEEGENV